MRTFTTDGPGNTTLHHLLPAAARLAEISTLVDQGRYIVFRAPGRSGKTTALRSLAANLTADGRFAALCCSTKIAASAQNDLLLAQDSLLSAIRIAAEQDLPPALRPPAFAPSTDSTALWAALTEWAKVCPLPIVLFFDDADSLSPSVLESIFQQLEAGFSRRPAFFPWSIGIVAQFDLRIMASTLENESAKSFSTGPFESFWSSRLLPPLSKEEIRALYAQAFAPSSNRSADHLDSEVIDFIYEASAGHPYFVQAFGREISAIADSSSTWTQTHAIAAFRNLVTRLESPIDNLAARLVEPRVRHVIEPLLQGHAAIANAAENEVQFVRDLGLITAEDPVRIEGALHRAILPRLLSAPIRRIVTVDPQSSFDGDGRLYMESLLQAFASFFAAHASELLAATPYTKIAAELVFLGFLFHIVQPAGWVEVQFGSTRGNIEILVTLPIPHDDGQPREQREVILLVARRKGDSGVKRKALEALDKAMLRTSSDSGTIVLFDKREKRRLGGQSKFREMATVQGKQRRLLRV